MLFSDISFWDAYAWFPLNVLAVWCFWFPLRSTASDVTVNEIVNFCCTNCLTLKPIGRPNLDLSKQGNDKWHEKKQISIKLWNFYITVRNTKKIKKGKYRQWRLQSWNLKTIIQQVLSGEIFQLSALELLLRLLQIFLPQKECNRNFLFLGTHWSSFVRFTFKRTRVEIMAEIFPV